MRTEIYQGVETVVVADRDEWRALMESLADKPLPRFLRVENEKYLYKLDLVQEVYYLVGDPSEPTESEIEKEPLPWEDEIITIFGSQWVSMMEDIQGVELRQIDTSKMTEEERMYHKAFQLHAKKVEYEAKQMYEELTKKPREEAQVWYRTNQDKPMEYVKKLEQIKDTAREIIFEEYIRHQTFDTRLFDRVSRELME